MKNIRWIAVCVATVLAGCTAALEPTEVIDGSSVPGTINMKDHGSF